MQKQVRGIIIGVVSLTFMLPLMFWYFSIFTTQTYFNSVNDGQYFLIGGSLALLFGFLYVIIKG